MPSHCGTLAVGGGDRHRHPRRAVPLRRGDEQAYGWGTFGKYILDERIFSGVVVTLELTVLSMILAIVLAVLLAVMRLSPNPVFRSVSWVYLWIFRGTPVYVQLVFWGLFPTIYKNIQLGIPFGPTFFTINIQNLSLYFLLAVIGLDSTRPPISPRSSGPASARSRRVSPKPPPHWACRG